MEIVIEVSDTLMEYIVKGRDLSEEQNDEMALAIANGTPLPKHHGRIIDESQIKHIECHTEQELYGTKIRYVKTTDAPTIIEAEGSESE